MPFCAPSAIRTRALLLRSNPAVDAVAICVAAGQVRSGTHCCSPSYLVIANRDTGHTTATQDAAWIVQQAVASSRLVVRGQSALTRRAGTKPRPGSRRIATRRAHADPSKCYARGRPQCSADLSRAELSFRAVQCIRPHSLPSAEPTRQLRQAAAGWGNGLRSRERGVCQRFRVVRRSIHRSPGAAAVTAIGALTQSPHIRWPGVGGPAGGAVRLLGHGLRAGPGRGG
jgi:hypothetical protein